MVGEGEDGGGIGTDERRGIFIVECVKRRRERRVDGESGGMCRGESGVCD